MGRHRGGGGGMVGGSGGVPLACKRKVAMRVFAISYG